MRRTRVAIALAALFSLAVATPSASGAESKAAATAEFKKAQQQYDKGQYAQALTMFREADGVLHSPNARLYIARCLRELGKLPEAYDEMSVTIDTSNERVANDPKYVATRDAAAAERAALELKIGRVIVAVANPPEGLAVKLNDVALDAKRIGTPVAVNAGHVVVVATAPGRADFHAEADVAGGEEKTMAIAMVAPHAATSNASADVPPPDATAPPPSTPSTPKLEIAGGVVAGLGVVGIGVFAITGAMANARFHDVQSACGAPPCHDPALTDRINGGKTLDTVANVALVAGGVGIAAGVTMFLLGRPKKSEEKKPPPADAFTFGASPSGASVGYRGAF